MSRLSTSPRPLAWSKAVQYKKLCYGRGTRDTLVSRNSATTKHPIGPVDPEIICFREIIEKIRKKKETRNAWQSLAYSPLSTVVSPLLNMCEKWSPGPIVWHYLRDPTFFIQYQSMTDRQTHDDGMYCAWHSVAR